MKKLYVGNLPYSYRAENLKDLFSKYGEVLSSVIIMDRASGRSKGFGFVELEDDQADAAMADLDNKEIDGRTLKVSEAKPLEK